MGNLGADIMPDHVIEMLDEPAPPPAEADVVVIGDEAAELPKHAVTNSDGSITLKLLFPVVLRWRKPGGDITTDTLAELVLHRLTGADMRAIAAASKEGLPVVAIARSARMSEAKMGPIYDRVDAADIDAASLVVGFFLGSGKKTGR